MLTIKVELCAGQSIDQVAIEMHAMARKISWKLSCTRKREGGQ